MPSYASCLRADIKPKNFNALKDYYEMLAKDADVTKVNEKKIFHEAKELVYGSKQNSSRQSKVSQQVPLNRDLKCFEPVTPNE